MKVVRVETFPVNVPFKDPSISWGRGGVSEVLVKLTADNGLVGWGESAGHLGSVPAIEALIRHAAPLVLGADPWEREAIARRFFRRGTLHRWTQLSTFAYVGLDHALWDLCGQACGQPVHALLGGKVRDAVDHCHHLFASTPEEAVRQSRDGMARGYTTFYTSVGFDEARETAILEAMRATVGPAARIRIDANERWTVPQAIRILRDWHARVGLDFCEAPVAHDLPEAMAEVRRAVPCPLSANECLSSEAAVLALARARAADVFCFAPYWVGTMARFLTLSRYLELEGLLVSKHTYGELGISATASHHACLCVANLTEGNQQMSAVLADNVLVEPLPIASGPRWEAPTAPGLGILVDEAKVARFHEAYRRDGQYLLPEYRPR